MRPRPFCIRYSCQPRPRHFVFRGSPRAWQSAHHRGVSTAGIYQELDHTRHEIRIIRINPGQRQDDVSCQLETVSLDRRPKYDTLSYNWGNSQDTSTICVNGQLVKISANLLDALRGVRDARKTVALWADALCIDQSNESEKSRQVAMMGQVYRQGRQTWISLGLPDEDWANGAWSPSPIADKNVGRLKRLVRGIWRLFWNHLVLHRSRLSRLGVTHVSDAVRLLERLESKKLDENYRKDGDMAKAMLTWLATREYWKRVWVMQEVALSRKDPICLFGQHRIPLLSLESVFLNWRDGGVMPLTNWGEGGLKPREQASIVVKLPPDVSSGINRAREICLLRDELWTFRASKRPPLTLARCAQLASHRRTSVAHDYIYGLHGLLSLEDQERVPVDYGLSIPELYASATKVLLRNDNSAGLLGAAVGIDRKNAHGLASWALNFSSPVKLPAFRTDNEIYGFPPEQSTSSKAYALSIKGSYLGQHVIKTASQDLTSDNIVDELGLAYRKGGRQAFEERATDVLRQILGMNIEAEPKPDLIPFLQVLTTPFYETSLKEGEGRGTPNDRPLDETLDQMEGPGESPSVRLLQLSREALQDAATMTEEIVADLQTQLREMKLEALSAYHYKVLLLFQYRQRGFQGENGTLFRTSDGRIGKCRGIVQADDEIWALPGSKTAFVLRPASNEHSPGRNTQQNATYHLVGPCICDGLAVDCIDSSDHTAQYIDII
ncbi:HET-domain-containing protein [Apiospora arundinis]